MNDSTTPMTPPSRSPVARRERAVLADARHGRVATANALIRTIAGCGRCFFAHEGRIGRIEIDGRGRLWFLDAYAGRRVYTAYRGRWRHFTNGGTLRRVVECLCEFIKTGERLPVGIFGPWPEWVCGGDMWGYGAENMAAIRSAATELGVLATMPPERVPVPAVDPAERSEADSRSIPHAFPETSHVPSR